MIFILTLALLPNLTGFDEPWVDETIPMILDLIKVVIGAAVGSLSAAGIVITKETEE